MQLQSYGQVLMIYLILIDDIISSIGCVAASDRMTDDQWSREDMEGSSYGLMWYTVLVIVLGRNMKNLSQDTWYPNWDLGLPHS